MRAHAGDLDPHASPLDGHRLVQEQRRRQPVQLGRPGERIAGDCDVVVAEHGERIEPAERLVELPAPAWVGQQVACGDDEIGPAFAYPGRRLPHGDAPARRRAEVEVGEVRDPQPVQLSRQLVDRHVQHTHAHPAGLEPAVGEACHGDCHQDHKDD